jgi:hypothetical protein
MDINDRLAPSRSFKTSKPVGQRRRPLIGTVAAEPWDRGGFRNRGLGATIEPERNCMTLVAKPKQGDDKPI